MLNNPLFSSNLAKEVRTAFIGSYFGRYEARLLAFRLTVAFTSIGITIYTPMYLIN